MKHIVKTLLIGAACLAPLGTLHAEEIRSNVGTLRCTMGPGDPDKVAEPREISCLFQPIAGPQVNYTGIIKKVGDPSPTADQLVLVWMVLATDADVAARSLEGEYAGTVQSRGDPSEHPKGGLLGGKDSAIELRPLTRVPGDGDAMILIILELNLKSIAA